MASLKIEEMVSVKYPLNQEAKESLNLLSPEYNESRPRVLKGVADYDKL